MTAFPPLFVVAVFVVASVVAYIPASPTNSTQDAITDGPNVTDIAKLRLQWYSNGSYVTNVSHRLFGDNSSHGISQGALVHFSEESVNESTPPTSAPWIAMVSCDNNATNASMETDIFTLAKDKGAVAALLYSFHSFACVVNPEYANPATFGHVFDIFSTPSQNSAHLTDFQFGQLSPANSSLSRYDSQRLNDSAVAIKQSIERGYPTSPSFLLAALEVSNTTGNSTAPLTNGTDSRGQNEGYDHSSNTALAMTMLYIVTGFLAINEFISI